MIKFVTKKDGTKQAFNVQKIANSIYAAGKENGEIDFARSMKLASDVSLAITNAFPSTETVSSEQIFNITRGFLTESGNAASAKNYGMFASQRMRARLKSTPIVKTFCDIASKFDKGKNPVGNTDLEYALTAKQLFNELYTIKPDYLRAHAGGDIEIHDIESFSDAVDSQQISLKAQLYDSLQDKPENILQAAVAAYNVISELRRDIRGSVCICDFDSALAGFVEDSFAKLYQDNIRHALDLKYNVTGLIDMSIEGRPSLDRTAAYYQNEFKILAKKLGKKKATVISEFAYKNAALLTDAQTTQAMDSLFNALCHVPNSGKHNTCAINLGTDTSQAGRMVTKNVFVAAENIKSPISPTPLRIVFKAKVGISAKNGDNNYDLLRAALRAATKRNNIKFANLDSVQNAKYYANNTDSEAVYGANGAKALENNYNTTHNTVFGRGNIASATINLVRTALRAHKSIDRFFQYLDNLLQLVFEQLCIRMNYITKKPASCYPVLMNSCGKEAAQAATCEALKNGTLSVGFIGLSEALKCLTGFHHGESKSAIELGVKIVRYMREKIDAASSESKLNFVLCGTEIGDTLGGRMEKLDKKNFGIISGITDADRYSDSFHIPSKFDIEPIDQIRAEALFHPLTNGGHVSRIRIPVGTSVPEYEQLLRAAFEHDMGLIQFVHE